MRKLMHRLASSQFFYVYSGYIIPWVFGGCVMFLLIGLVWGLYLAPLDYQQQAAVKIMYVHVPSAFLALLIYSFIGINSIIYLIWRIKLVDIMAAVSAPIGAGFAVLALLTGAIWGKPMWGTWWIWDARLTSTLILLFIYLGYIGIRNAIYNLKLAAKCAAIFGMLGLVDLPIIHYSVTWWNTLHQGASLAKFAKPDIDSSMLYPLLAMLIAFVLLYCYLLLVYTRAELIWRERNTNWVRKLITEHR